MSKDGVPEEVARMAALFDSQIGIYARANAMKAQIVAERKARQMDKEFKQILAKHDDKDTTKRQVTELLAKMDKPFVFASIDDDGDLFLSMFCDGDFASKSINALARAAELEQPTITTIRYVLE